LAALWFEAMLEVRAGDAERVRVISERFPAVLEHDTLPEGRAGHAWFRGWSQARLGDPPGGYCLIREGCEQAARLGIRASSSESLGYVAEALALAGDWPRARQQLERAMQYAEAIGERIYLTQLLLLDARISEALGEPKRARERTRQALDEARAQQSVWLQLIALTALCGRKDATAAEFESLRCVLGRVTGGANTAPVAGARALLERR
jgi:hypothetical protein